MSATMVRPVDDLRMLPHAAPERSTEQRMEALQRANDIRHRRKLLKAELRARRVHPAAVLIDPPEFLLTAKVFDVLLAVPKVGRVKASKLLGRAGISPSKTIGGMSERQRYELAVMMGARRRTG